MAPTLIKGEAPVLGSTLELTLWSYEDEPTLRAGELSLSSSYISPTELGERVLYLAWEKQ